MRAAEMKRRRDETLLASAAFSRHGDFARR
jgi:hypothetical protein